MCNWLVILYEIWIKAWAFIIPHLMSHRGELGGDGLSRFAWSEDLQAEKWRIREERATGLAEQSRAAADESSNRLGKGILRKETGTRVTMAGTQNTQRNKLFCTHNQFPAIIVDYADMQMSQKKTIVCPKNNKTPHYPRNRLKPALCQALIWIYTVNLRCRFFGIGAKTGW